MVKTLQLRISAVQFLIGLLQLAALLRELRVELDRFSHMGHRLSEAVGDPGGLGDIIHGCVHDLLLLHGLLAWWNGDEPSSRIIPSPHHPLSGGVPRASARGPSRVRRGYCVLEEP